VIRRPDSECETIEWIMYIPVTIRHRYDMCPLVYRAISPMEVNLVSGGCESNAFTNIAIIICRPIALQVYIYAHFYHRQSFHPENEAAWIS
jgi:hypothetical protein